LEKLDARRGRVLSGKNIDQGLLVHADGGARGKHAEGTATGRTDTIVFSQRGVGVGLETDRDVGISDVEELFGFIEKMMGGTSIGHDAAQRERRSWLDQSSPVGDRALGELVGVVSQTVAAEAADGFE